MKPMIFAAAALALTAGTGLAQQTVRMGTEAAYPPYNFTNDRGEVDGYEREVGDELCKRAELSCNWVKNDWDSIIPNLLSGNYDTIMAGMSITEERAKVVAFTENYIPPTDSAYAAASGDVDVNQAVVAAQTGTVQASHVAETGATLLEFATGEETIAAVRNGEADAVFSDKDFLQKYVDESNGTLQFVGDAIAIGDGIGMALRPSDTELKAKFDTAIQSMKADGSLNALIGKWFGDQAKLY